MPGWASRLQAGRPKSSSFPGAWVFTVGPMVYSVDRSTLQLTEARDTALDTFNASGRLNAVRFPSELVLASEHGGGQVAFGYAEWRLDLNGRFQRSPDGGVVRELTLPGTWASHGGLNGLGPGSTGIAGWDAIVVASGWAGEPAIGVVPRDPARPPWIIPIDAGIQDTTGAIELADGTVLIGLNTRTPPLPAGSALSLRTDVWVLSGDGGLTATGWSVTQSPPFGGGVLAAGGDAGAVMVTFGRTAVSVWERDLPAAAWVGEVTDAGFVFPAPGAVKSTAQGRLVALAPVSLTPLRYGNTATSADLYLVSYPPGRVSRVVTGLRSLVPPGIGALREDSFILTYYDELTGLHAARLCLPQ